MIPKAKQLCETFHFLQAPSTPLHKEYQVKLNLIAKTEWKKLMHRITHYTPCEDLFKLFYTPTFHSDYHTLIQNLTTHILSLSPFTQLPATKHISVQFTSPCTIVAVTEEIQEQMTHEFGLHIPLLDDYVSEDTIILSDHDTSEQEYTPQRFAQVLFGYFIVRHKTYFSELFNSLSKDTYFIYKQFKSFENISIPPLSLDPFSHIATVLTTPITHVSYGDFLPQLNELLKTANNHLKEFVQKKSLSLTGDELLQLMQEGGGLQFPQQFTQEITTHIREYEQNISKYILDTFGITVSQLFSSYTYPLSYDEELLHEAQAKYATFCVTRELDYYEQLGKGMKLETLLLFLDYGRYHNLCVALQQAYTTTPYVFATTTPFIALDHITHPLLDNPSPINYYLQTPIPDNQEHYMNERVAVLTGANSGGKTTLLETILHAQILFQSGLPLHAHRPCSLPLLHRIHFLKKFSGSAGSGAFEQTITQLLKLTTTTTPQLILIDEFESITEPGFAALILSEFLHTFTKLENTYTLVVSHLGKELMRHFSTTSPPPIRIDGIQASGLDEAGNLLAEHQPQFYQLGKSTPELILRKILHKHKEYTLLQTILDKASTK